MLGQVEAVVEHGGEGLERVRRLRRDRGEAALEVLDGLFHDHVEAVLLGLEVVIERRRSDADVRGDIGPLRVLVPVAAEALRRGGEDLAALRAVVTFASCARSLGSMRLIRSHVSYDSSTGPGVALGADQRADIPPSTLSTWPVT